MKNNYFLATTWRQKQLRPFETVRKREATKNLPAFQDLSGASDCSNRLFSKKSHS